MNKEQSFPTFVFLIKEVVKGNGLWRALMHHHMSNLKISGTVFDLGAGAKQAYFSYLKDSGSMTLVNFDQKGTANTPPVNVEKDRLPKADQSADVVIMSNILEHIYDYDFTLKEVYRVLKTGGRLIGFVPFFCHYHPGPRDFFRYTHEALENMFTSAGFDRVKSREGITSLGFGPCTVSYHSVFYLAIPRRTRKRLRFILAFLMPFSILGDFLMRKIYPALRRDFPLGYAFEIVK